MLIPIALALNRPYTFLHIFNTWARREDKRLAFSMVQSCFFQSCFLAVIHRIQCLVMYISNADVIVVNFYIQRRPLEQLEDKHSIIIHRWTWATIAIDFRSLTNACAMHFMAWKSSGFGCWWRAHEKRQPTRKRNEQHFAFILINWVSGSELIWEWREVSSCVANHGSKDIKN